MILRLFKSFAAQPRLAIVTATLHRASTDLLHFGIVFLSVYACMMVNSVLFFGQDLDEFSTVPRAMHTCFLALHGDWDWTKLKEVGYFRAAIWFWMFMLINVLILTNMLLAIIMDAYANEKARAGSAISLWQQTFEMRRRRIESKKKERVNLTEIYDAFLQEAHGDERKMLASKKMLKLDALVNQVPGIKEKQAKRLLIKAMNHYKAQETAEITEDDIRDDIKDKLDLSSKRTGKLKEDVRYIINAVRHYDTLQANGDAEFDLHFGNEGHAAKAEVVAGSVENVFAELASNVSYHFEESVHRLGERQQELENKQQDLHGVITEMQSLVAQQATSVGSLLQSLEELLGDAPERL